VVADTVFDALEYSAGDIAVAGDIGGWGLCVYDVFSVGGGRAPYAGCHRNVVFAGYQGLNRTALQDVKWPIPAFPAYSPRFWPPALPLRLPERRQCLQHPLARHLHRQPKQPNRQKTCHNPECNDENRLRSSKYGVA